MTRDELNALLRPHPPGVPMPDHLLDALAEHLMSDTESTPAEHAAWKVMLMNVMKIVETLHEIRPK